MTKDDDKIDKLHLIKRNPELPTLTHSRIQGWTNTTKLTNIQAIQTLVSKMQMLSVCALSCTRHSKDKTQDQSISPCIPTLLHWKVFLTDAKIQQVWEEKKIYNWY